MKLIKENLFEFTRGGDPLDTLGIGYTAKIHKFFDDLGVSRNKYYIKDKRIEFNVYLSFLDCIDLVELPNNLAINSSLNLKNCINLKKLPEQLWVGGTLDIRDCTKLVELPDNLYVDRDIYTSPNQTELMKWIESSKFKHKVFFGLG